MTAAIPPELPELLEEVDILRDELTGLMRLQEVVDRNVVSHF